MVTTTTQEKMLRHAGERLGLDPAKHRAELVARYQRFVRVEEHRLRILHRGGASGREVARGRGAMLDVVMQKISADARVSCAEGSFTPPRIALVALGGYGRGELSPHSDIDIMFLHQLTAPSGGDEQYLRAIVEGVLYPMWDIGFKVGYSCRSIKECLLMAGRDMVSKTSLIEARWLTGDRELFGLFQEAMWKECVKKTVDDYIAARLQDQEERHKKFGDTVFLQEPNVKSGCGGLRDYQNLLWMTYFKYGARDLKELEKQGFVTPSERKQLEVAYDFILRVRNELHYLAGRPNDVIALSLQGKIATHFGYRQRDMLRRIEAFMRDYYLQSRAIFLLTNTLAQRMALKNPGLPEGRSLQAFLARRLAREERKDGFIFRGTMMLAASSKIFTEDPLRLIRVFRHAQVRHLELAPELRSLIRDYLVLVGKKFQRDPHARDTFLAILAEKGEVGRSLRQMYEVGFLGKYLPEFGRLICLVQHEFYHRYTADEHTLQTIERLDEVVTANGSAEGDYRRLYHELQQSEMLTLGLLLHDAGRAANAQHHEQASARLAQRLAERWQLESSAKGMLLFLVQNHAILSVFAQRRDLEDPESVAEFARLVQTQSRLDALYLMTYADSRATAAAPSHWQESLRRELYEKTKSALQQSDESAEAQAARRLAKYKDVTRRCGQELLPEEIEAHITQMPLRYWWNTETGEILENLQLVHAFLEKQMDSRDERTALGPVVAWKHEPDRGYTRVTVCCWDRTRLFARMAGSFAVAGLNILSAQVYTRQDDIVIDTFRVTDAGLGAILDESALRRFQEVLTDSLLHDINLRELIISQPPPALPERPEATSILTLVSVTNDLSRDRTVIEVQAEDRIGLLFVVVDAISLLGLQISSAQIATEKGAALDSFYVVDRVGQKITAPDRLAEIERTIQAAVGQLRSLPASGS